MITYILAAAIAVVFILVLVRMFQRKKRGQSFFCGGDCNHCQSGCQISSRPGNQLDNQPMNTGEHK